jgi:hypothetical protein
MQFRFQLIMNEAVCYVTSGLLLLLLYHHLEADNLCLHPEADNLWVQCPRPGFPASLCFSEKYCIFYYFDMFTYD